MTRSIQLNIRVPPKLHEALRAVSYQDRISITAFVIEATEAALKRKAKRQKAEGTRV